jgi:hypothetical protein
MSGKGIRYNDNVGNFTKVIVSQVYYSKQFFSFDFKAWPLQLVWYYKSLILECVLNIKKTYLFREKSILGAKFLKVHLHYKFSLNWF